VGFEPGPEGAEVTKSGRLFQTRAAGTGKAWSPTDDGRQSGAADNQWWRWTGTKSLTSLNICHRTKLVDKVCRCRPVETLVHKDCMYLNTIRSGAFSQCSWRMERSDELELWRGKNRLSIGHWLNMGLRCRNLITRRGAEVKRRDLASQDHQNSGLDNAGPSW